jgi:TatD DNase family protein
MNHSFIDNFCNTSISSCCDQTQTCQQAGHIPPDVPLFDGHIHLNQIISKIDTDLISVKKSPPIREFHFVNNNHKPSEWPISHSSTFLSHVHVYPTIGIHPKYFDPQSLYHIFDDMKAHLEISCNNPNPKNKFVAVGECGLDETSTAPIEYQIFVLEKQIDFAVEFHLPIVIHCRGTRLYRKLFDCLKYRTSDRNIPIHWHCVNSNSDLHIIDLFLNEFPNSYIGINGSITYETNIQTTLMFKTWLFNRSPFLPDRLILETDYPYLPPRNLHGIYDPSSALLATAVYLSKTIENPNRSFLSYVHSSNVNIKSMYYL